MKRIRHEIRTEVRSDSLRENTVTPVETTSAFTFSKGAKL
jgi:hypothetical protein